MVDKPVAKKTVAPAAKSVPAKPVAAKAAVETPAAKATAPVAAKPVAAKPAPAKPVQAKPVPVTPVVAKAVPVAAPAAPVAVEPVVEKPVAVAAPVAAPVATTPPEAVKPVLAAVEEGKKVMTDTFAKVEETAKKFTAEAGERANAMFGDLNARAKDAMAKGSKTVEEMVEFSKGNLEAVVASGRVAAKGAEEIAKYTVDYGRKAIEEANANAKKFAAVKSPTEFFALQSEVAKANLDAVVTEASKFSESYLKLLGEIAQPIQNRYAVAVEKVKSAVAA